MPPKIQLFRVFGTAIFLAAATGLAAAADPPVSAGPAASPPNRLIHEKSPYLRQHASNPVDWYPWGPEAFEKARRENQLIFLSVGYSTCHWCHVMERESFSNPDVAALLNASFVCIKVDREERPDVDRVYMIFLQASTGGGGWPMTVWLTPDLKPVFGGTYFPPTDRAGQPGLTAVCTRLAALWAGDREKILGQAEQMFQALVADTRAAAAPDTLPIAALRQRGLAQARETFDEENGGFERAPKFPNPGLLDFLLDVSATSADAAGRDLARRMAVTTLHALAAGGIHDQLGGGFHRYSVDATWRVPHFEKMAGDQAQLAGVYLTAWQLTSDPLFRDTAMDTLRYVQRDLTSPGGGFDTAEDADSTSPAGPAAPGEGTYYLWTASEIETILGPKDAPLFAFAYGVEREGNTGVAAEGELAGRNVLFRAHSPAESAARFGLAGEVARLSLEASASRLRAAREKRPRPMRDDKIVTALNGLMISAFARGAQVLGEDEFAATAGRAASFLRANLYDPATGRLARSWRAGVRDNQGFADDYAFLIQGLLDLYETTFETRWLEWAIQLQEKQNELFGDPVAGGFFANTADDTSVLLRLKGDNDGAEPSPNSIAVRNLARLAGILHRDEWLGMAARTARAFGPELDRAPLALPQMVAALGWLEGPPQQILIHGEPHSASTGRLVAEVWRRYLPHHVLVRIDRQSRPFLERQVEFIRALPADTGDPATAYVCENFVCRLPTHDPAVLAKQLTRESPQK